MIRWRRPGVSLIVLFMLAAAPVVAAACAELCTLETAGSAMAHDDRGAHDAGMLECHKGGTSAPAASLLPASPCGDHARASAGTVSLTAGREDTRIVKRAQALVLPAAIATYVPSGRLIGRPDGDATLPRPTLAPLVLRI